MHTSLHLGTWPIFTWELGKTPFGVLANNGLTKQAKHQCHFEIYMNRKSFHQIIVLLSPSIFKS